MKTYNITIDRKIEVNKSPVHGWGVFATSDIPKDTIIEEVPFLILPIKTGEVSGLLIDYRFNYPQGGGDWVYQVIPYGYACLYNHSDNPNARWTTTEDTFIFETIKPVKKGEEIFTYYGDASYWNDGRKRINVI